MECPELVCRFIITNLEHFSPLVQFRPRLDQSQASGLKIFGNLNSISRGIEFFHAPRRFLLVGLVNACGVPPNINEKA